MTDDQDIHDLESDLEPETDPTAEPLTGAVGDMSPRDFARLGLNRIAYVRAVTTQDDETGWAIFAANGQRIGLAPTCDQAFAATRQHDMVPLSVH